jgi:cell surface protein SprA
MRNKSTGLIILEPNYVKTFNWNRLYDIRFDLTRSLRLEYNATANARIDEPQGRINRGDEDYQWKRDSIWQNVSNLGRTTFYNHRFNLNYNIPINKLPLLDWLTPLRVILQISTGVPRLYQQQPLGTPSKTLIPNV